MNLSRDNSSRRSFVKILEKSTARSYLFRWVTKTLAEVKPEEYDGLVIPGRRVPEYVRVVASGDVKRVVRHIFERNTPVAAICYAPATARVVKGREVTSHIAVGPEAENNGGIWVDQEVVVDGNLVTARAWLDNPAWMREFIKLLKSK
ncbi:DJ-1/PfpI family protein [Pyrobaculum sp.]|uniref:DJ-1/PfpI family protein n=1 Tax=Pyrobaculum sp. TaxID=2004705 RepID=UPI000B310E17